MSIRTRNVHRSSAMHPDTLGSVFNVPATDVDYFINEIAASHADFAVGKYLTFLKTIMPGTPQSVAVTTDHADHVAVMEVIGINQFGDRVTERVNTAGSATLFWTNWAYKSLISVQVISATSNSKTVAFGTSLTTPRLALPFVPIRSAEVVTTINYLGAEKTVTTVNLGPSTITTQTQVVGMGLILSDMQNFGLRP